MRFRGISEQEMWVFKVEIQGNFREKTNIGVFMHEIKGDFRGKNKDEFRTFPTGA